MNRNNAIELKMNRNNAIELLSEWCIKHDNCDSCKLRLIDCDPRIEWDDEDDDDIERAIKFFLSSEDINIDTVNHPSHYQGAHECIDVMRAMFGDEAVKGFCRCNAYKYRFRADSKNGAEDIQKAEWYEDYLIRMEDEK